MTVLQDAPSELQDAIREFWPHEQWDNAAAVASLESAFDPFAVHNSTDARHPCGAAIGVTGDGVTIAAELSVGYFQINACSFPTWEWQRFYNARHNAGTAHMLWDMRGWAPWYFSAKQLGLL